MAAQSGDRYAMEELMALLHPAVLRFCRSRLWSYAGGQHAADDVAQETCVAVLRALPRWRDTGVPFAAWVFTIASNKIADLQRRQGRAAVCVEAVPERPETSPTPEERLLATVERESLGALLARLPERMQQILTLKADGYSAEQVGELLGMTPNAVRVARHRAVARLRALTAAQGHDGRASVTALPRPDRQASRRLIASAPSVVADLRSA